jgi:hypothetical protein
MSGEPMDPNKARDELRRLIDAAEPVTAEEARALAAGDPSGDALTPVDGDDGARNLRQRAPMLLAAAAAVVLLVGGGLLVWQDGDEESGVTTGPSTTTTVLGPVATVLPPVGDDPIVSCDPDDSEEWYPLSAWSRPPGDEFADDPAAHALLSYQRIMFGYSSNTPVDENTPLEPTWRRLWETDDLVLFGAGDFNLEAITSDETGPIVTVARVRLDDDGEWRYSGVSSGTCNELTMYPGPDRSIPQWWIDEALLPLSPDATEVTLSFGSWLYPCGPAIDTSDIIGPDIIETSDAVTIRAVIDVPQRTPDDDECARDMLDMLEEHEDDPPIEVTVRLREPLGSRIILDGSRYPAAPVNLEPEPEPERRPPAPRIELPGATNEVQIMAVENNDCAPEGPAPCGVPSAQVDLTVTVGGETFTGSTNDMGSATVLVPDGSVRVEARADGRWCPTVEFNDSVPGSLIIACVRLDLPHATVSGTLAASGVGDGWLVTLTGPNSMRSVAVAVEPDGTFEAVLDPGRWRVGAMNADWSQTCTVGPVGAIEVADGVDQTLDLTCD